MHQETDVGASWNEMAHAQKADFLFRRNGRVHLNRPGGRQFSRLLAAEVWSSAVIMLDTPCSEIVWRVLATHSISQFPLHFPSSASPFAIIFQLKSTKRSTVSPTIKMGERLVNWTGYLGRKKSWMYSLYLPVPQVSGHKTWLRKTKKIFGFYW